MSIRSILMTILLGLPALGLVLIGPRQRGDVPAGRVLIRYWEKWTGVEARAMQHVVEQFNRTIGAEKGIWVEYCAISNVDQRLLVSTAGGDPPDVAGLFDHAIAQFADQGALTPLEDLATEFGIDEAAFKPVWWGIGAYDGRLWALPAPPYTIALYYNKRLFREAGLDPERPPETIEELTAAAEKLTRRSASGEKIDQLGFTLSPAMLGWWHWVWPNFFDARLWDGEMFTLDSPAGVSALTWVADHRWKLALAGLSEPVANRRRAYDDLLAFEAAVGPIESPQNPFLCERLAMVFQGPWLANWASQYAPHLEYGVAPFPSVSRERKNTFASADVFVIPRGSPHVREAMEFLRFVMRQDVMEKLCQAHGKATPFREPLPDFYAAHPNPHIRTFDAMANSPRAFGYPKTPIWSQAWIETLYMLENVLRLARDPADAVRDAQKSLDAALDQYSRMSAKRRGGGRR